MCALSFLVAPSEDGFRIESEALTREVTRTRVESMPAETERQWTMHDVQDDHAPHPAEAGADPHPSIWRNDDFLALLLGQGVSNTGDAIAATALPLLVLSLTGSGTQMGAVEALQGVGALLFGLMAGVLADRWDRRRILLRTSAGLALLTGVVPLAYWVGWPVMPVIYLIALPLALVGTLFGAAYTASIPRLVGRANIGQANSYFEGLESFAWIVGPGIAGILIARMGAAPTLLLDSVSFLMGAAAISLIRRPLQNEPVAHDASLSQQLRTGLSFIAHHAPLRSLLSFWWALRLLTVPFVIVMAYLIKADRGETAAVVGLAVSAYAAGSLAGTLLAGRFGNRPAEVPVLAGAAIGGLGLAALAWMDALPLVVGGSAAFGLAEGFILVVYLTGRAHAIPDELLGRVSSTAMTVSNGMGMIGVMAAGVMLDRVGGVATLTTMGAATLVVVVVFGVTRALRGLSAGER